MLLRLSFAALWCVTTCGNTVYAQSNRSSVVDAPYGEQAIDGRFQLPIPITLSDGTAEGTVKKAAVPTESPQSATGRANQTSPAEPEALLLPPRPATDSDARTGTKADSAGPSSYGSAWRTFSSLAVVVGLFLVFVWFVRRNRVPLAARERVFHTLGRVSLLGKQAHIVQFGDKLLVLAKTANGLEKLTELSNPVEVERVTELCQRGSSAQLAVGVRDALLGNTTVSSA